MAVSVLIVEDDPMARKLMEIFVSSSENYHLVPSLDSAALAELYCMTNRIDLILMDVCTAMDASGLEAAAKYATLFVNTTFGTYSTAFDDNIGSCICGCILTATKYKAVNCTAFNGNCRLAANVAACLIATIDMQIHTGAIMHSNIGINSNISCSTSAEKVMNVVSIYIHGCGTVNITCITTAVCSSINAGIRPQ